jgi:hypothetical protein
MGVRQSMLDEYWGKFIASGAKETLVAQPLPLSSRLAEFPHLALSPGRDGGNSIGSVMAFEME